MSDDTLQNALADSEPISQSYLDLNLEDAQEEVVVDEGEYELTIVDARIGQKDEASQPYLLVRMEINGVVNAKDLTHVMMLPDPTRETAKQVNRRKLNLRHFFDACGVDYTGTIDVESLKGCVLWGVLSVETTPQYGEQNRFRRPVIGA